jgi:hypothetical protein
MSIAAYYHHPRLRSIQTVATPSWAQSAVGTYATIAKVNDHSRQASCIDSHDLVPHARQLGEL